MSTESKKLEISSAIIIAILIPLAGYGAYKLLGKDNIAYLVPILIVAFVCFVVDLVEGLE